MGHHGRRLLVAAVGAAALAWLAYAEVYVPSGGHRVPYSTTAIGRLQLPRATTEIFRTRADYDAFVTRLDVGVHSPRIDFGRADAVLIALGPRSSAGSSIRVVGVEEQRGRLLVVAREEYRRGMPAVVSYPSVVVVVRESDKPIVVRRDD